MIGGDRDAQGEGGRSPSDWWPQAFIARLGRSRKVVRKALSGIERLWLLGEHTKAMRGERKLMRSYDMRLMAAHKANLGLIAVARRRDTQRRAPIGRRYLGYSARQIERVASDLNLWKVRDEPVAIRPVAKPSGGTRDICSFEIENRAAQVVVKMVLENRPHRLHPGQISRRPRGLEAAISRVRSAAEDGYKFAVKIDIQDFYGSISTSTLAATLSLPGRIVETVIGQQNLNLTDNRNAPSATEDRTGQTEPIEVEQAERRGTAARHIRDGSSTDSLQDQSDTTSNADGRSHAQRGIPQGSSCSPIVADFVMADLLRVFTGDVRVVCWVDDVLILTKSREEAQGALHALRAAIAAAPEGPFSLKEVVVRRLCDGVDFVGWSLKFRKHVWQASPSPENLRRVQHEVAQYGKLALLTGTAPREGIAYLRSWRSHFRTWSGAASRTERWQRDLADWANLGQLVADHPRYLIRLYTGRSLNPGRAAVRSRGGSRSRFRTTSYSVAGASATTIGW